MDKFTFLRRQCGLAIVMLTTLLPLSSFAADTYNSLFVNDTQKYDPAKKGYQLEVLTTWGDGCVADAGKQILAPSESTILKINQNCEWAGVKYKIVKDTEIIGYVSHSFRDKNFSVEISLPCKEEICSFTGLPPKA